MKLPNDKLIQKHAWVSFSNGQALLCFNLWKKHSTIKETSQRTYLKKLPQGIFHRAGDYVREEYFRNRIVYISIMIALLALTFVLIIPWLQFRGQFSKYQSGKKNLVRTV